MAGEYTGDMLGILFGWNLGDSTWKTGMDANLKMIDTLLRGSVLDRNLTAPPGGESNGDAYIVGTSPSGAWSGHENDIAVYTESAWYFITPEQGQLFYIEDEEVLSVFKTATGWSAGVAI